MVAGPRTSFAALNDFLDCRSALQSNRRAYLEAIGKPGKRLVEKRLEQSKERFVEVRGRLCELCGRHVVSGVLEPLATSAQRSSDTGERADVASELAAGLAGADRDSLIRRFLAIHEAGHAILHILYGWPFEYVAIRSRNEVALDISAPGSHFDYYSEGHVVRAAWTMDDETSTSTVAGILAGAGVESERKVQDSPRR
jgi:hypothetical protein